MKSRQCAVCGRMVPQDELGTGIRVPKTTCLICAAMAREYVEVKVVMPIKRTVRRVL
jgi:hypothetical protein